MKSFAQALETVPLALAENSGLSPIDTLTNIRSMQVNEVIPQLGVPNRTDGLITFFFGVCTCASQTFYHPQLFCAEVHTL